MACWSDMSCHFNWHSDCPSWFASSCCEKLQSCSRFKLRWLLGSQTRRGRLEVQLELVSVGRRSAAHAAWELVSTAVKGENTAAAATSVAVKSTFDAHDCQAELTPGVFRQVSEGSRGSGRPCGTKINASLRILYPLAESCGWLMPRQR